MLNRGYAYTTIISSKYRGRTLVSHLASLYPHSTLQVWQQNLERGVVASKMDVWGQDASWLMNLEEKVNELIMKQFEVWKYFMSNTHEFGVTQQFVCHTFENCLYIHILKQVVGTAESIRQLRRTAVYDRASDVVAILHDSRSQSCLVQKGACQGNPVGFPW
jgi:hypothetical protein